MKALTRLQVDPVKVRLNRRNSPVKLSARTGKLAFFWGLIRQKTRALYGDVMTEQPEMETTLLWRPESSKNNSDPQIRSTLAVEQREMKRRKRTILAATSSREEEDRERREK